MINLFATRDDPPPRPARRKKPGPGFVIAREPDPWMLPIMEGQSLFWTTRRTWTMCVYRACWFMSEKEAWALVESWGLMEHKCYTVKNLEDL